MELALLNPDIVSYSSVISAAEKGAMVDEKGAMVDVHQPTPQKVSWINKDSDKVHWLKIGLA